MSTVKTWDGYPIPEGAIGYSAAQANLAALFYAKHGDDLVFCIAGMDQASGCGVPRWEKSIVARQNTEWFPAEPVSTPRIVAHEFLERGVSHMRDRAVQRDSEAGERSMARAVAAFNAQEGTNLTEAQGWRFMIQLKYARAVNGVFVADDYEDLAAYAGFAGEAAQ